MELTSNGSFIKLFCLSLLILLISISFLHFLSFEKNTFPVNFGENWYLLIAHPDDETMFFSPTLFEFEEMGAVLHILCVTSGNSDGKGLTRIKELYKASSIYGIPSNRVYILDPDEKIFSDGFVDWNITKLADLILERVKQQTLKGIITFDEWGVSGHSNHISCFKAIEIISKQWNNIKFFALKSVPLWRKYLGIFDVYLTKLLDGNSLNSYRILSKTNRRSEFLYKINFLSFSAYIMVNNYKSQMRWFRYLFLTFSRYLYINTFVLIN